MNKDPYRICSKPIVDLRATKEHLLSQDFSRNEKRLTQLEHFENVKIVKQEGPWLFVEAIEQLKFTEGRGWHGYPGWVHESDLAPSRDVEKKAQTFNRKKLIEDAHAFLDAPYLWGGKGKYCTDPIASVDCSGLSHLIYRYQSISIPRDAHDQFLLSEKIEKESLLPGDLIFWAPKDNPARIAHVVIYNDRETYIEAPESGKHVRILPLPADFYEERQHHFFPDRIKPYLVFCGKFSHLVGMDELPL